MIWEGIPITVVGQFGVLGDVLEFLESAALQTVMSTLWQTREGPSKNPKRPELLIWDLTLNLTPYTLNVHSHPNPYDPSTWALHPTP